MDLRGILDKVRHIHFIGIGGSGMCSIAEILVQKGYTVTGSDNYESDTFERLKDQGLTVFPFHASENIKNAELVVYSAAIKKENVEMIAAEKQGIPMIERSVMLGLITEQYKIPIAIAGTHGKTSTTSMLTQIMIVAQKDPTSIIGGKLPLLGGNSCFGQSDYIICEACEYVDSFLRLHPQISLITNIEPDHLDYFKNLDNIVCSFNQFAKQTNGALIINGDDENIKNAIDNIDVPVIRYGLSKQNIYRAEDIKIFSDNTQQFSFTQYGEVITEIKLQVPGDHNILNALAAATVAYYIGIQPEYIAKALLDFTGAHRRFERVGKANGVTVIDDFAHHPTELTTTLRTAARMKFNHVIAVFQPHTYSRTALFLDDFAQALSIADKAILSEILAVREVNAYHVYASDLAAKVKDCVWFETFEEIADFVAEEAVPGDLVITLGGGNVYECANLILQKLAEKSKC